VTLDQFKNQLQRLANTFGAKNYPEERAMVFWKEFKYTDFNLFQEAVSRAIAEELRAPMISKLRDLVSGVRQEHYAKQKQKHKQEAEEFFHSGFDQVDINFIVQTTLQRMSGKVPDRDWSEFLQTVKTMGNTGPQKLCPHCDNGIVVTRDNFAFVCFCDLGLARTERFPRYSISV
jgi:hypothetical protein